MNISVLGSGRWGAFLAWYSCRAGHDTVLWGRPQSISLEKLKKDRCNEYLRLQDEIVITSSLQEAVCRADTVLVAISAQELRQLAGLISNCSWAGKTFVLCMKGLEAISGKRLSEVFREELAKGAAAVSIEIAVWVGPGHVQDFVNGIPNCMVISSSKDSVTKAVVESMSSELIRLYYGDDLIGIEIGAASKNVIGIAAGMLDAMNSVSLKGALMARGAREISRLIKAMGGNELTAYGLSHLGDYEATLYSHYSHNRRFGENFVKGAGFDKLAEGVATASALKLLSGRHDVELPICSAVHSILFEGRAPQEALLDLFLRPLKYEFSKN